MPVAGPTDCARNLLALVAESVGREADRRRLVSGHGRRRDRTIEEERPTAVVAAAAVTLGAALSEAPGLVESLSSGCPVVLMEVPSADWIAPVARVAKLCFGADTAADGFEDETRGDAPARAAPARGVRRAAVIGANAKYPDQAHEQIVREALSSLSPLIGVGSPSSRALPADFFRICDRRVAIGRLDQEQLALVVEAATGTRPTVSFDETLLRKIELADLRLAVCPERGADGSMARLETIVGRRGEAVDAVPPLRAMSGYGRALDWGLGVVNDIKLLIEGRISASELDRGALLFGPPGTGKTQFARSMARDAGVPMISGSLAAWQSNGEAHLGTTLKAMRQFFEEASRLSPVVALIDELDSFGNRSLFSDRHKDYSIQIVNGLLECLDGSSGREGVVLIGTTNIPERIDPAILRSGRFDRRIEIFLPGMEDIARILRQHLGRDLEGVPLGEAARRGLGASGADCEAWVRRARSRARREGRIISMADLSDEIGSGSSGLDPQLEWRIAVHEGGHAVTAYALGLEAGDVALRTAAGSFAKWTASDLATRCSLENLLTVLMAGRAAELVVLGSPSAGAGSDLAAASAIARSMHVEWGLGRHLAVSPPGETTAGERLVVERELAEAMARASGIVSDRRDQLHLFAKHLVERRALSGREVVELLAAPPVDVGSARASVAPMQPSEART